MAFLALPNVRNGMACFPSWMVNGHIGDMNQMMTKLCILGKISKIQGELKFSDK